MSFYSHWKRFITESNNSTLERNLSILGSGVIGSEQIKELRSIQSPLSNNSIVKLLGSGKFGSAYLLSNNHVFKIGDRGPQDRKFFTHYRNNGSDDFKVFGYYEFKSSSRLFYAEMTLLVPFEEWLRDKCEPGLQFQISYALGNCRHPIKEFADQHNREFSSVDFMNTADGQFAYDEFFQVIKENSVLSEQTIKQLWNVVLQTSEETRGNGDLRMENLGVNLSKGIDMPQFFFFDR